MTVMPLAASMLVSVSAATCAYLGARSSHYPSTSYPYRDVISYANAATVALSAQLAALGQFITAVHQVTYQSTYIFHMAPHVSSMRGTGLVQERVGGVKHQAQFSSLIICWGTEGLRFARQRLRIGRPPGLAPPAYTWDGEALITKCRAGAVPASAHGAVYGVRCRSYRPRIHFLLAVEGKSADYGVACPWNLMPRPIPSAYILGRARGHDRGVPDRTWKVGCMLPTYLLGLSPSHGHLQVMTADCVQEWPKGSTARGGTYNGCSLVLARVCPCCGWNMCRRRAATMNCELGRVLYRAVDKARNNED